MATTSYELQYMQAVEPDTLPRDEGIGVFVHPELDGQGFNEVTLSGPTPEAIIDYVCEHWGTEDPDWVASLSDRIVEVGTRTILVHLNIEAPLGDKRTPEEIAKAIVGMTTNRSMIGARARYLVLAGLSITAPLAEEV